MMPRPYSCTADGTAVWRVGGGSRSVGFAPAGPAARAHTTATNIAVSLAVSMDEPPCSVCDAAGDRPRGAEGRDEDRVLAGAARNDDHDIPPVARHGRHGAGRPILEALRMDSREALDILRRQVPKRHAGPVPKRALEVIL